MKIAWPRDKLQRILMMPTNGIMLSTDTFNDNAALKFIDLFFRNVYTKNLVIEYISTEN